MFFVFCVPGGDTLLPSESSRAADTQRCPPVADRARLQYEKTLEFLREEPSRPTLCLAPSRRVPLSRTEETSRLEVELARLRSGLACSVASRESLREEVEHLRLELSRALSHRAETGAAAPHPPGGSTLRPEHLALAREEKQRGRASSADTPRRRAARRARGGSAASVPESRSCAAQTEPVEVWLLGRELHGSPRSSRD